MTKERNCEGLASAKALTVKLANGIEMPQLGFGVYQIDSSQCAQAVCDAIREGYRLIDTAAAYFNEQAVGEGIKMSGVDRSELFVTTKVWVQDAGYAATMQAFDRSLEKLGLDYLDLYLIHQPLGDYYGSWRAMEELYAAGRVRAIGVCNFQPNRIADLSLANTIAPMVNQIELHPFCQREPERAANTEFGVKTEAWAPFAEGKHGIFTHPVLSEIAAAHGKSAAQVALRWNLQLGNVVLAKSVKPERMAQNIDVFDFELTDEEMARIAELNLGESLFAGHESVESVRMRFGFKVHS